MRFSYFLSFCYEQTLPLDVPMYAFGFPGALPRQSLPILPLFFLSPNDTHFYGSFGVLMRARFLPCIVGLNDRLRKYLPLQY